MVHVEISDGILEGQEVTDNIAGKYYSFKGIPYAAPPVGDLRFQAPQPVKPWNGVKSAKEFGSACYQADMLTRQIFGSEDCLYLNVYTPDLSPKNPLPVMVWIHGGAFTWGSGNDDLYGPEFLVKHGVILVTFNYRLGILGFLCLDSKEVPGNAGMKDQVAALRWVNNHINKFGGDPDNVTVFGESAGGMSASYHLVSPMSKGLFRRAICQSGTMTFWSARLFEHLETAKTLAKQLGFYSEDKNELYDFFKTEPIEHFINFRVPITVFQLTRGTPTFFCVVDEQDYGNNERFFFGQTFDVLKKNGIHENVDVITGCTEDEGVFVLKFLPEVNELIKKINALSDYIIPDLMVEYCNASQQIKVCKRVKERYFLNKKVTLEDLDQIIKYLAIINFIYGTIQWAKIVSSNSKNNRVFLYHFGCNSERNIMSTVFGLNEAVGNKPVVCHGDDLLYLFPAKISGMKVEMGSETYKLIENVTSLWTNFAKFGHPTPDDNLGVKWLPYNTESEKYLHIANQLRVRSHLETEDIHFWEDLYREFCSDYVY